MLTLLLSDESGLGEAVFYPVAYQRLFYRLNTPSWLRGKQMLTVTV